MYRDALPGAEAKRKELLNRARAELAAQPLEVRRIFVNRVSSATAGITLIVGGLFTALIAASPEMYSDFEALLPGRHPAVVASVLGSTLFFTLLAYFVARSMAEERFTRAMLRVANPTGDVFLDIERLHHTPTREALRLADRARRPARYALTAGIALIATPLVIAAGTMLVGRGWTSPGNIDSNLIIVGSAILYASLIVMLAAAFLVSLKRPTALVTTLGIAGLLMLPSGGALAVWGGTSVGLATALAFTAHRFKRQEQTLAFGREPSYAPKMPRQPSRR